MIATHRKSEWIPVVEIKETNTEVILKTQFFDAQTKYRNVQVTPDTVILRGNHCQETMVEENGLYHSELLCGNFSRTVMLPQQVQNEKVQATFEDSLLTLTMPKIARFH